MAVIELFDFNNKYEDIRNFETNERKEINNKKS